MDQSHERPAKRVRISDDDEDEKPAQETGLMRRDAENGRSVFVGSASGNHFVRLVYSSISSRRNEDNRLEETADDNIVPGEDDQLMARCLRRCRKVLWAPWEILDTSDTSISFTFDDLMEWSQSYWDHWHPAFPFLHAPTVLTWFDELATHGVQSVDPYLSPARLTIIRAIISISLVDQRQSQQRTKSKVIPSTLLFRTYEYAVRSVQGILNGLPTIEGLQSAVAVQLFLISMLRHNAASRVGGLVVRMLYNMGLHRCPLRYPTFSDFEIDLRKRLFWVIYCIDRHIGLSLGLPITIRDDDIDICSFDQEEHSENEDRADMDTRLMVLKYLSHVFEIKGMILELCNKNMRSRKDCPRGAARIASRIAGLRNDIDNAIDVNQEQPTPFTESITIMFTVLLHECTISLQRPKLAGVKGTWNYNSGLQSCITSARAIITTLYKHLSSQRDKPDPKSRDTLTWPTFTWAVWSSAFIMFYAALENQTPMPVANKLASQAIEILEHLALRGSVWPKASAEAIRDLSKRLEQGATTSEDSPENSGSEQRDAGSRKDTNSQNAPTATAHESAIDLAIGSNYARLLEAHESGISQHASPDAPFSQSNFVDNGYANGMTSASDPWLTSFPPLSSSDMTAPNIFEDIEIPFWLGQDDAFSWMHEWQ